MAINLKNIKQLGETELKKQIKYMKTFTSGKKLHLPYISFSSLGYTIWKDLNYPEIEEHYFLGFRIK